MEADIEWNVLFLSLEGSSLVVVFFVFVDRMLFRFLSKWYNAVVSDLGRFFLKFSSVIMGHVARLPLLMVLMRVEGIRLNFAL